MAVRLHAELFVPATARSHKTVDLIVRTLLLAGLRFERVPGRGGSYWSDVGGDVDPYDERSLEEALGVYARSKAWAVELHRPSSTRDEELSLLLSIASPDAETHTALSKVHLSLRFMPNANRGPTLLDEFAAITKLIAALTDAWYGWAGGDFGLFLGSTEPIAVSAVAALEPQPIEWLNIYGLPYRDAIGIDRLRTAPAWRSESIANGGFAITLAPEPKLVTWQVGKAVADHLQVPVSLP